MKDILVEKIERLKEEKNAVILAHNYQNDEIQAIADYTGDSLGLSRKAANIDAEVIVFCGVDFMAESAAILAPDKKVLLPERNAECPMAEMVTAEELKEKKKEYPKASVVCYVNSSAAIKAESDICCTSSNAVDVVESIANQQIIFVPDKNLAQYVANQSDKEIILWDGYCPTHHRVRADEVKKVKKAQRDALILVHPECRDEVVKMADYVGSTAQILDFAQKTDASKLIIGTEMGILYKLRKDNPEKKFYLLDKGLVCANMKLVTLEKIVSSLENLSYQVSVEQEVRVKAKKALDRMLKI